MLDDHHLETVFDLIRKYKFMLVFEEANCNDFVTPLFWSAIQLGIVPVYMGAPNIDEFSPTDYSVIQVTAFLLITFACAVIIQNFGYLACLY